MRKHPNLVLGGLLVLVLALAALQSHHLSHLRDSEQFYRYIISACNQLRLEGRVGPDPEDAEIQNLPPFKDEELFQEVVALSDAALPDIPPTEDDYDKNGVLYPKIVRYASIQKLGEDAEDAPDDAALRTKERHTRDKLVWKMACGKEAAQVRDNFLSFRYDKKLWALGSQLGTADLYQDAETSVSLGSMFFGFRKMAANLLWLEVDKYWHAGYLYRMVPLMRTTVTLDPTFVDAYLVGAWHLAYNMTAKMEPTPEPLKKYVPKYRARIGSKEQLYFDGIDFLKDGIQKNPRDYRLYFDLGYGIYEEKLADHTDAVKYLSSAIKLKHDRWVRRALYRCYQYNGQYDEALEGWRLYLEKFGDTQGEVASRFVIYNEAFIFERDAKRADERADAAERIAQRAQQRGDTATADEYTKAAADARAESAQLYAQSVDTWNKLGPEDTTALSRRLYVEAIQLAKEKRYVEAIAKLDNARYESGTLWDEASQMIVDIKKEAGEPLTKSERDWQARLQEAAEYNQIVPKVVYDRTYDYEDGVHVDEQYNGEEATTVAQDTDDFDKLVMDYPDVLAITALGDNVVFRHDNQWYRYMAKASESKAEPKPEPSPEPKPEPGAKPKDAPKPESPAAGETVSS